MSSRDPTRSNSCATALALTATLAWSALVAGMLAGCDAAGVKTAARENGQSDNGDGSAPPQVPFPPVPDSIGDLHVHAVAVATQALRELPEGLEQPYFEIAKAHRRFGFDEKAIELYRRGLELNGNRPDAWEAIGFLVSQRNLYDEALDAYRTAVTLDPRLGGPRTRIGLILVHQGKIDEAIREYRAEIQNGTASVDTYYNLGQAYIQKKEHARAEAPFRECLRLDPEHENAQYGLFQVYRNLGRPDEARAAQARFRELKEKGLRRLETTPESRAGRAKEIHDVAETYLDIANLYMSVGFREEALQAMKASVIFDPEFETAQILLVDHLRTHGEKTDALDYGLEAVASNPESPELLYLVAGLSAERGRFRESASLLERLLEIEPFNANGLRELARVILRGNLYGPQSGPRAREFALRAVDVHRDALNLDVLAYAHFACNDSESAMNALEEAVGLDPENKSLRQRLDAVRGQ